MKKNYFQRLRFILLVCISFLLFQSCEKDDTATPIQPEQNLIKTVSREKAIDFVKNWKSLKTSGKEKGSSYITTIVDTLIQEDLIGLDEKLTLIPVETSNRNLSSRIALLEFNGEIKSVVFSTKASAQATSESFWGEILLTTLEGQFLNGFIVEDNKIIGEYTEVPNKKATLKSSGGNECLECPFSECDWCQLDTVYITTEVPSPPTPYISITYLYPSDGGGGSSHCETCGSGGCWNYGSTSDTWDENLILLDDISGEIIKNLKEYLDCFDSQSSAELTIYADQPTANSTESWSGSFLDPNVGHTFISIKQNNITRYLGFYPQNGVNPTSPSTTGIYVNDSGHDFDVSVSINLSPSQFSGVYNHILNYNSTYNLNSNNCTDFGISVGNLAGLQIGSCYGTWPMGGGDNPGKFGEVMRNLEKGSINKSGGTAASNTGNCN